MATRAGRSGPAGDSGQVLWSWRELGGNVSDDTLVSSCRHAHRPPAFERRAMQGHWRSQTIPCMGVSTRPNGFEADILMYSTVDQPDLRPLSPRPPPARRRGVRPQPLFEDPFPPCPPARRFMGRWPASPVGTCWGDGGEN